MTTYRSSVRFLLGDELRNLDDFSPTMTVLEYLRTVEYLTGTKEGCGEGDCGACSVVVGEVVDGRMVYQAVNACIRFLPTLDGCQLLTVESLADRNGALHPVQSAMVAHHATQCGFCTPGFVMSLYALYRSDLPATREVINDTLAGNLCRCTGYGSIVTAAQSMSEFDGPDPVHEREAKSASQLERMDDGSCLAIEHGNQRYFAPTTADDFAGLVKRFPEAVILSGGTDVGLWVTKQGRHLQTVIDIGRVRELRRVDVDEREITVWAAATQTEILPIVTERYPDFGELLRRFGSVQVRNAATLCGNVANGSPIGDTMPPLIALGARVGLRCGDDRRELPLEDFYIDYGVQDRKPGEFVEKVVIPVAEPGWHFSTYKISKRFDQDISAVCAAFNVRFDGGKIDDVRIAYGGMAATPKRAAHAESVMIDATWSKDTVLAAMQALEDDFNPISDMRASASYRMLSAKNLLLKFYLETGDDQRPLRLVGGRETIHGTG